MTTKVVCVAGVLCAGGLFALRLGDDPVPAAGTVRTAGDDVAANGASAVPILRDAATDPAAATALVADEPWLTHAFAMQLEVLVVDELGLPVAGHTLQLAPAGCTLNHADDTTNGDGRAVVAWRARAARMDVEVSDARGQLRRIVVEHGKPAKLLLLGKSATARWRSTLRLGTRLRVDDSNWAGDVDLTMRGGLHPHARFTDQCAVALEPDHAASSVVSVELALHDVAIRSLMTSNNTATFHGETLVALAMPKSKAAIAGTVFGEDGTPAADAPIVLLGSGPQPLQRGTTDEQGCFRFDGVAPGEFTVRAGGDSNGLATVPAAVTAEVTDGVTPVTLQLQCGACVRGRAIDQHGDPVAKAHVEWRAHDGSWADATTTGDDGTFVLANLPGGPGSVSLSSEHTGHRLPLATLSSVLPDTGELLLRAAPAAGSTLKVEPIDPPDGGNLAFCVWQVESGLGERIHAPLPGAIWALHCLPAGFYEVEVRAAGGGRRHLGRLWLDGSSPCDLGRVALPAAGEVVFVMNDADLPADDAQRAFEVIALRADADVRMAPACTDRPMRLPPGDYALAFRGANGTVHFRPFTVTAGQSTTVTSAQ